MFDQISGQHFSYKEFVPISSLNFYFVYSMIIIARIVNILLICLWVSIMNCCLYIFVLLMIWVLYSIASDLNSGIKK